MRKLSKRIKAFLTDRRSIRESELASWANEECESGRVLDLGVGFHPIKPFLKKGLGYVGSDCEKEAVAELKRKGVQAVKWDFNKNPRAPFKDKSFSCVIASEVIYYSRCPYDLLRECSRILKPGGALVGSVTNANIKPATKALYSFNEVTLRNLLEDAGFEVKKTKWFKLAKPFYLPFYPPFGRFIGRRLFFKARKRKL